VLPSRRHPASGAGTGERMVDLFKQRAAQGTANQIPLARTRSQTLDEFVASN
jgi:hypothetical protein